MDLPSENSVFFFCSHTHIESKKCSKGILQSVKGFALSHAELIPIIQPEDPPLMTTPLLGSQNSRAKKKAAH